jgi:hypothetical protein
VGHPSPTQANGWLEWGTQICAAGAAEPGGVRAYLNLTVGYVSQLERGVKQPKGPALALLNVIRRKGLGVML